MQFYYTNDWLSVYRKDFPRHPVEAIPQKVQKSEPLFAPFRQPQHLKVDNCKHLPNEPSESKSEFLKRNPVLAERYFKKELYDKLLCREYDRSLQSLYQRDICREDDIVQKGKRSDNDPHAILPDNWHYPITSHTCSYRNPKLLIDVDVRGHNMKRKEKDAFVFSEPGQI
ncbi:uncharacterized protein LOC123298700 [Chrysoperla carnea]|uniref:uncharacterized protein LOC123298700 n=1 Tax=Chrysoperla carnea TaxID=189513 RepID=UPI001D07A8D3|nr:uncharacterized protein LOC123298700 [Chrysoperla carnea]